MKYVIAVALFIAALVAVAFSAEETNNLDKIHGIWFGRWTQKFNKKYANEEESKKRFNIFKANLKRIQDKAHEHEHFMTKFMDLTPEEFKAKYLSHMKPSALKNLPKVSQATLNALKDTPTSVDWRQKSKVSRVKDQGDCGSCWAFSTTGNIESQWAIKNGSMIELSEQYLVDCGVKACDPDDPSECNEGCNGGLMDWTFPWLIKTGGLPSEKSYPYYARDRKCDTTKPKVVTISDWKVVSDKEDEIAAWVAAYGPVSIGLNADGLQFYSSGIYKANDCSSQMDHGVLIVGYGSQGSTNYWIVKNSWGQDWGEQGYFRIVRGKNACGLNQDVSTSIA